MILNLARSLLIAAVLTLGLPSCGPSSSVTEQTLTLTGASTVAPVIAELGKKFEGQNPGIRIDVQTGGSSRGISDTRQGLADIGMVSRDLIPAEGQGMQVFQIGLDGISFIVHADNPVASINREQVVQLYTGQLRNWQVLGGKDAPITVLHRAAGHSTLQLFLDYFGLQSTDIQADAVTGDNQQGIKTVAGNPNAIGYVSIGHASYDIQQGVGIKLLALDGVNATTIAVAEGRFPLKRPLNLITLGTPSALAQRFIDFAQAPDNHDLIVEQNFIPPSR